MDILKSNKVLNYIVFITLIVLISSCENEKKRIKQQGEACYNDTVIQFRSNTLSFLFVNIQNFEDMEIYHIRGGQKEIIPHNHRIFPPIYKNDHGRDEFRIKKPSRLYTHDTIRLVLNNAFVFDISNFRNAADFGGSQYRYLGCILTICTVNGNECFFLGGDTLDL